MRKYFPLLILLSLLMVVSIDVEAQCAMCKAQLESGGAANASMAKGLNKGIIFLMVIPYLLLMGGLWYFFGKDIKAYFRKS